MTDSCSSIAGLRGEMDGKEVEEDEEKIAGREKQREKCHLGQREIETVTVMADAYMHRHAGTRPLKHAQTQAHRSFQKRLSCCCLVTVK